MTNNSLNTFNKIITTLKDNGYIIPEDVIAHHYNHIFKRENSTRMIKISFSDYNPAFEYFQIYGVTGETPNVETSLITIFQHYDSDDVKNEKLSRFINYENKIEECKKKYEGKYFCSITYNEEKRDYDNICGKLKLLTDIYIYNGELYGIYGFIEMFGNYIMTEIRPEIQELTEEKYKKMMKTIYNQELEQLNKKWEGII
jgi:hypothetical protein